jgi:hypothetical protein
MMELEVGVGAEGGEAAYLSEPTLGLFAVWAGVSADAGAAAARQLRAALDDDAATLDDAARGALAGVTGALTALAIAGPTAVVAHRGGCRCHLLREGHAAPIRSGDADGIDVVSFDLQPGDAFLLGPEAELPGLRDEAALAAHLGDVDVAVAAHALRALAGAPLALVVRVPAAAPRGVREAAGLDAVRHITLLRDLTAHEVGRLLEAFTLVEARAGQVLVREGERGESMFVLASGAAEVVRRGVVLRRLPAGSHFGEIALLADRPRTATVRALEACSVLVTRRATLYQVLRREPLLAAKLFWNLAYMLSVRVDDLYSDLPRLAPDEPGAPVASFGAEMGE